MSAFIWPVAGDSVSYPITRGSDAHIAAGEPGAAVDIACPDETPLVAPMFVTVDVVITQPDLGPCGRQIDMRGDRDGHHYLWRYCHLSECQVGYLQQVAAGQQVGLAGMSGVGPFAPDGPHCHVVLWVDGVRVRPEDYLIVVDVPAAADPAPAAVSADVQNALDQVRGYSGASGTPGNLLQLADELEQRAALIRAAGLALQQAAGVLDTALIQT